MLIKKQPSCEKGIQFDVPISLIGKQGKLPREFWLNLRPDSSQHSSTPGETASSTSSLQSNSFVRSFSGSQQHSPMRQRNTKYSLSGKSDANRGTDLSGSGSIAIDVVGPSSAVEKYVHWCVDSSRTHLHDICVESKIEAKKGQAFIKELLTSYKKLRGIRWWFSLTHCAGVKLVKVSYSKDASACGASTDASIQVLPNLRQQGDRFMSARKIRRY